MRGQEHVHGYSVYITSYIDGKAKIKLHQHSGKGQLYKNENISGKVNIEWSRD